MYSDRIDLYKALAAKRQGTVLVLITGDRAGWETVIAPDVIDPLADHLDAMVSPGKVSLVLYTRGGQTKRQVPTPQGIMEGIDDQRSFEGWKKIA
jgi:hypothetical protein